MKVSVIILNWNGSMKGLIHKYLPSVVRYTPTDIAEVVVADNGSNDDSLKVLANDYRTVRVIAHSKNYGFAEGYNRAIAQCEDSQYVVLLNDDARVTEGWLERLVDYMDTHRDCGAIAPKLLKDYDSKQAQDVFEYAGACGGYLDKFGYPFCRGRIFDTVEEDHGQYDLPDGKAWDCQWATGACLMVRREQFVNAGGLDARFFAHMEEIDLCWRLRRMGYKIACLPSSVVYHKGGASLPQGNPLKTKLNFRNSLVMLWKNLPADVRDHVIRKRMVLDGIAALNFLLHGQLDQVGAIWKAHREYSKMIKEYSAQELIGFGTAAPFETEKISILWHYYVRHHRTFTKLS